MSINLDISNDRTPPSDADTEAEKKKVLDLSLTQVVGGALAAMTAAALGSTLGVGGTIAGAAFASVVAGVAGSLYTASLRTGRDKVATVFRGQTPNAASAPPRSLDPAVPVTSEALQETAVLQVWDPLPLPGDKPARKRRSRPRGAFPWRRAVAVSLAIFALAVVLITGYERVSGEPLSGGTGTTVSQVRDDTSGSGDNKPAPVESTSPTAEPSSPAASESPAPAQEPSAPASASPTPSESTPSESTPTPSEAPSLSGAGSQESAGATE